MQGSVISSTKSTANLNNVNTSSLNTSTATIAALTTTTSTHAKLTATKAVASELETTQLTIGNYILFENSQGDLLITKGGKVAFSSRVTCNPLRARCAAVAEPPGPAPTTTTSDSI